MCQECARIQASYEQESERLTLAQRDLARYDVRNEQGAFARLWKECESALRALWSIREEMTAHAASHGASSAFAEA